MAVERQAAAVGGEQVAHHIGEPTRLRCWSMKVVSVAPLVAAGGTTVAACAVGLRCGCKTMTGK